MSQFRFAVCDTVEEALDPENSKNKPEDKLPIKLKFNNFQLKLIKECKKTIVVLSEQKNIPNILILDLLLICFPVCEGRSAGSKMIMQGYNCNLIYTLYSI